MVDKFQSGWEVKVTIILILVTSKHFINAGVWLSTLLFWILAIVAGLVSTTLALYNTVDNPTEFFLRFLVKQFLE